jgi:hypothetical protein
MTKQAVDFIRQSETRWPRKKLSKKNAGFERALQLYGKRRWLPWAEAHANEELQRRRERAS